jgi:hypothetical protein
MPGGNTCMIHWDFSENFTCRAQDSIQSAYWHQRQVSLFTVVIYKNGKTHCVILVSDDLDHSKRTIIAYIHIIFEVTNTTDAFELLFYTIVLISVLALRQEWAAKECTPLERWPIKPI